MADPGSVPLDGEQNAVSFIRPEGDDRSGALVETLRKLHGNVGTDIFLYEVLAFICVRVHEDDEFAVALARKFADAQFVKETRALVPDLRHHLGGLERAAGELLRCTMRVGDPELLNHAWQLHCAACQVIDSLDQIEGVAHPELGTRRDEVPSTSP